MTETGKGSSTHSCRARTPLHSLESLGKHAKALVKSVTKGVGRESSAYDIRTLRTHLRRLRLKLGDDGNDPTYIVAEPRVGYRMLQAENLPE